MNKSQPEIAKLVASIRRQRRWAYLIAPAMIVAAVLLLWRAIYRTTAYIDSLQALPDGVSPDEIRITCFMDAMQVQHISLPALVSCMGLFLLALIMVIWAQQQKQVLQIIQTLEDSQEDDNKTNQQ